MNITKKRFAFEDTRGKITDILEKEPIEYVTIITSNKGSVRGNHYHKESVQYAYVIHGSLKVRAKMPDGELETAVISKGDLLYTPPWEIHTFHAIEDSMLLILTRGPRGGADYEKDTYRVGYDLFDR